MALVISCVVVFVNKFQLDMFKSYVNTLTTIVVLVLCASKCFRLVHALDCLNAKQELGQCVLLPECPSLETLLTGTISADQQKYLYDNACGSVSLVPKICCTDRNLNLDRCSTAVTKHGRCKPVRECASLMEKLKTMPAAQKGAYLKSQICTHHKNPGAHTCCPANTTSGPPKVELTTRLSTANNGAGPVPNPLDIVELDDDSFVFPDTDLTMVPHKKKKPGGAPAKKEPPQLVVKMKTELPSLNECGYNVITDRIIGGTSTDLEEFPWMVILKYYIQKLKQYEGRCGGSLINQRYVLTAAHCLVNPYASRDTMLVVLGEYDTSKDKDCNPDYQDVCNPSALEIQVDALIPHSGWVRAPGKFVDDIGLVRMRQDVVYTDNIKPICLPLPAYKVPADTIHVIAGWGRTENRSSSDVKKKLDVNLFEHAKCKSIYSQQSRNKTIITDKQFCAGGIKGKDSCNGDSGGPLMTLDDEHWFLSGIISFGVNFPCGKPDIPGVYTNVSAYVPWIEEHIS